jgi:hypothetical protein
MPDFVVKKPDGSVGVVEAKFGTGDLRAAQRELKRQMGDAFQVSRTTYEEVRAAGGVVGSVAGGVTGNCVNGPSESKPVRSIKALGQEAFRVLPRMGKAAVVSDGTVDSTTVRGNC